MQARERRSGAGFQVEAPSLKTGCRYVQLRPEEAGGGHVHERDDDTDVGAAFAARERRAGNSSFPARLPWPPLLARPAAGNAPEASASRTASLAAGVSWGAASQGGPRKLETGGGEETCPPFSVTIGDSHHSTTGQHTACELACSHRALPPKGRCRHASGHLGSITQQFMMTSAERE